MDNGYNRRDMDRYTNTEVIISKVFILFSLASSVAIISNCRCVFGPHFPSFTVCSQRPFLCLFGHSNCLIATLAEIRKKQYAASHTGELKSESVAFKALLKAELCATCDFSGKVTTDTRVVILQMQGLSSMGGRHNHHCVTSFGDR